MQSNKRNRFSRFAGRVLVALLAAVALSSCERIFEDLDPCLHGVSLRFVYDYNMEYANAFPNQVDCLTLYIYDENDDYVDTRIVTGTELQDENYRMKLDLPDGKYHFVAYGGIACEKSSFTVNTSTKRTELKTRLNADCLSLPERKLLHDMFWGELTMETAESYNEGTVKMMKNTNGIRIVLQQVAGGIVNAEDFDFEITDDNTLFDYDNDLLPVTDVTYTPWVKGQARTGASVIVPGVAPDPIEVAYAELSVPRLMARNSPRLVVKRHADKATVIDIPLNKYLLLMQSDRYDMGDQEYLDRESRWTLFFFLKNNDGNDSWLNTCIVVNDWVVRINDVEL